MGKIKNEFISDHQSQAVTTFLTIYIQGVFYHLFHFHFVETS